MSLIAKATGNGNFTPVSEGMHQAVCIWVVDLGTQWNETYKKSARKVAITWEIPEERIEIDKDGETQNLPRVITKTYTNSLHEKAVLRKDLESWRGRSFTAKELEGFDLSKLVGVNATLQVLHVTKNDTTYANISNVLPLMKGQQQVQPETPTVMFALDDKKPIPDQLPEWIGKIIMESDEWQEHEAPAKVGHPVNEPASEAMSAMDDVPF